MIKHAAKPDAAEAAVSAGAGEAHIAPVPRISIQAFCEVAATASIMQAAGEDRRMGKAHLKIQMGGIAAAAEAYRNAPTPNVVIIESNPAPKFESAASANVRNRSSQAGDGRSPGSNSLVQGGTGSTALRQVRSGKPGYIPATNFLQKVGKPPPNAVRVAVP